MFYCFGKSRQLEFTYTFLAIGWATVWFFGTSTAGQLYFLTGQNFVEVTQNSIVAAASEFTMQEKPWVKYFALRCNDSAPWELNQNSLSRGQAQFTNHYPILQPATAHHCCPSMCVLDISSWIEVSSHLAFYLWLFCCIYWLCLCRFCLGVVCLVY